MFTYLHNFKFHIIIIIHLCNIIYFNIHILILEINIHIIYQIF